MAPLPAADPPFQSYTPLPSNSPAVIVSVIPTSSAPPAVLASYSSSNSSDSSVFFPLYLALSDALSSVPLPPKWYFPPAPLSCVFTGGSSVILLLHPATVAEVSIASVLHRSAPSVMRFVPLLSLYLPPVHLPPPPTSLGILRPPAPPLAPPPLAQATNISRNNKYVGDRTGTGEARWSTAGGSAPRGKYRSRPLAVVGGGISRPLFLDCQQQ